MIEIILSVFSVCISHVFSLVKKDSANHIENRNGLGCFFYIYGEIQTPFMLIETLISIFDRDLTKLKTEIELFEDETSIWTIEKNIANSAGNLCLHLTGNLLAFIGAQLGNTGYVRNRDLEFSAKDIPKAELVKQIEETMIVIHQTLNKLTEDDLNKDYPVVVFAEKMTIGYFLVHLATHLGYHLGQINYHRRLLG